MNSKENWLAFPDILSKTKIVIHLSTLCMVLKLFGSKH